MNPLGLERLLPATWLLLSALGCEVHVQVLDVAADGASPPSSSSSPCGAEPTPVDVSRPEFLVGNGSPESCTDGAVASAIEHGGVIAFRCGPDPVVIALAEEKVVLRDTVIDGGNTVTLDGAGTSRLLVLGSPGSDGPSLTLQNLTLRRGHATATAATADGLARGGGGAILQWGGRLTMMDSVLRENEASDLVADEAGGAICSVGGSLTVARSSFEANRAGSGGAIAALGAELVVLRTQFSGNRATGDGVSTAGIGGAVLASQEGQSVRMCQVTMAANQAQTFGTAMHLQGIKGEPVDIEQTSVVDNASAESAGASGGPAVFLGIVSARLTSVTVARNQGKLNPGVWVNGEDRSLPNARAAAIQFTNVTIAQNRVYRHADPSEDGVGAALWIEGVVRGELVNCTLADNVGEFGSGIVHPQQLTLRNTIVANQGTNVWNAQNCSELGEATLPATGSQVLQWPEESVEAYACIPQVTLADPLLGPLQDNGGFVPTMMPATGSPAVGMGTDCPSTDARSRPRPARCSLGATEADTAER